MSLLSNDLVVSQNFARGSVAVEKTPDGRCAVASDCDWFSEAARTLYPQKAGTILFLNTGLGDERLCQRYAAGTVKPPAYFLRALLRGQHGNVWLPAVMDGSDAQWWRELDAARALLLKFKVEHR